MSDDLALDSNGATVVMATASDERYPPEHMLDGKESTFWSTTGLYPHEFIVALSEMSKLSKVKVWSSSVRKLTVEKSDSATGHFEKLFEIEFQDKHNRLQTEVHQVNCKAQYLKFIIGSGWDDFCTIHKVSIM
mmetsp:Transcript_40262/g.48796  ORF Transcript_40262/g.48796 Transcript_40262/m.48796 type:complete len:133 (+) Transcript_40262:233-631(+)|eukprot:CAMPEP_0197847482 /NCGR_PEP_ID=MMETSP1438-20131217/6337_1 /TAXON_ID=1461541 /ORGANISM="Pterosperma sp., Strain CCMP1384" /LENGTH=132 /DNA_ID=CAMNT_0043459419 /DNA_START=231 /DNA_END=629 /DNA_ORIENTATION=+